MAITSAIRYAVCTHETSVELAERPAWMSVSEAETTWMSRIDMNIPNTMIRNATSRRGSMRSAGAAMIAELAVVVVMFGLTCGLMVRDATPDAWLLTMRVSPI